jgi:hypothetical protein
MSAPRRFRDSRSNSRSRSPKRGRCSMIWLFDRRKQSSEPDLRFTNSASLFEMACKYGHTEIGLNQGMLAVVLDAKKEFGTPQPVKLEADGTQTAVLRVVSEDGGFVVPSKTLGRGPPLSPDDAVIWVPVAFSDEVARLSSDRRCGWVRRIRAKVNFPASFKNPFENITRYG